jgi:hypothetical protein
MTSVFMTQNYGDNLHQTAQALNLQNLVEWVFSIHSVSGQASIVIFKVPTNELAEFERRMKS